MTDKQENNHNLIGKRVVINDRESFYYGEWGTVAHYDGDYFYVRIANGEDSLPAFDRKQLQVMRVAK